MKAQFFFFFARACVCEILETVLSLLSSFFCLFILLAGIDEAKGAAEQGVTKKKRGTK